jgi:hypothetical protein
VKQSTLGSRLQPRAKKKLAQKLQLIGQKLKRQQKMHPTTIAIHLANKSQAHQIKLNQQASLMANKDLLHQKREEKLRKKEDRSKK